MSSSRLSSVFKGLGGSGIAIGVGGVLGYFFYKKAVEDIREVVEESKKIMCRPEGNTVLIVDKKGNKIGEIQEEFIPFFDEDEPREVGAKSEQYKKSATIILRSSMMLLGFGLSIYMMAEKGAELYQFIESFDPGAAGQQVLSATVTGVTLTLLPAMGVSAGTPVAKIVEAGAKQLSYYASSFFKGEKEYKKKDDIDDEVELAPLINTRKNSRLNLD